LGAAVIRYESLPPRVPVVLGSGFVSRDAVGAVVGPPQPVRKEASRAIRQKYLDILGILFDLRDR